MHSNPIKCLWQFGFGFWGDLGGEFSGYGYITRSAQMEQMDAVFGLDA